ncbi:hypothetical protein BD410DRAFT_454301 [Rickenella mellea]|uniref:C2H2-type domain-containing protein n=1 Tax=Rickenella mellea TaxID=50990 RepID=A0A4Y7PV74_9AGAM|nr:hypothetical protein BD410DRAFT_454301 [Rickenella mellea]
MDANTGHVVQADLRTHEAPSTIYIPHHDPQLLSSTSYQVQVPHIHGTLHRTSTEDVLTAGQWPPLPVSTPNLRRTSTLPAYYPSTVSSPLPRLGSHYRVPSSSSMGSMTTSSSRSSSISPATPPIPESWNQASFLQYVPPAWPAAATSQLQPQAGPSRPDQFVNTSRSWTVPNNWDQSTAGTSSTLRTPTAFGAEPNASYGTRSMRIPEQQCSFQEYHGFQTQVASSPAVQLESRAGPSRTREPAKSQKRAAERSYDADKASRKSTTGRSSYEPGPSNFISPSSNIVNGNEDVTSETKICRWDGCGQAVLLTKKAPSKHYRQHHRFAEPKKRQVFCKWSGCGKDTLNESMERHYVRHFEIPHMCSICGQVFSRDDVVTRHNCKGTSNV